MKAVNVPSAKTCADEYANIHEQILDTLMGKFEKSVDFHKKRERTSDFQKNYLVRFCLSLEGGRSI